MASYNFMKAADRAKCRVNRQAEITAVDKGNWPRDLNDQFRWGADRMFCDRQERAVYARGMCQAEIDYLDGLEERINASDSDLAGWEPSQCVT